MALTIHTAEELSKLPFLNTISLLKKEADSFKPLSKETDDRILQKFRLDWNYHSNAIEGNKLTYGETVAFIMEGLTAKGKPFKDHLDIQGHDTAIKFLMSLVKDKDYLLTEVDIRNLHKLTLKESYWSDAITDNGQKTRKEIKVGEYKLSPNHVRTPTGEIHYYATPEATPMLMGDLMEWYKAAQKNLAIHPIVIATLFHHEFTSIHPFDDGNGRMARLLMNLILMQDGYPPIVIKQDDREQYYQVLRQADAGEMIPIVKYMSDLMEHSLNIYIKGAKGESIAEGDDVDKEIALFKQSLNEDFVKYRKERYFIEMAMRDVVAPFFNTLFAKLSKLEDLFVQTKLTLVLNNIDNDMENLKWNSFENLDNLSVDRKEGTSQVLNYNNITNFSVEVQFGGYKKIKQSFNVNLSYKVSFQDYEYYIIRQIPYRDILNNIYGWPLTKELLNNMVKIEIDFLLKELKSVTDEQKK